MQLSYGSCVQSCSACCEMGLGFSVYCLGLGLGLELRIRCSLGVSCCDGYCTEQLCTEIFRWNYRRVQLTVKCFVALLLLCSMYGNKFPFFAASTETLILSNKKHNSDKKQDCLTSVSVSFFTIWRGLQSCAFTRTDYGNTPLARPYARTVNIRFQWLLTVRAHGQYNHRYKFTLDLLTYLPNSSSNTHLFFNICTGMTGITNTPTV